MKNFDELLKLAKEKGPKRVSVIAAHDEVIIEALKVAHKEGIVEPILIGDEEKIKKIAGDIDWEIIHEPSEKEAALKGVSLVSSGKSDMVLKGKLPTSVFLKAVLDKEVGLRTGRLLSHIVVLEIEKYHKLLFITDGGMNIRSGLKEKIDITNNAIELCHKLGIEKPKVGLLAAIEVLNPDMPETEDASVIAKMAQRGQIKGAIVDGPLAMDLMVDKDSCKKKGVESPVCGDVDIIVVPEIVTGNGIAKGLLYLANTKAAGIVMGAASPVVMLSRSDSEETKLYSLALGVVASD